MNKKIWGIKGMKDETRAAIAEQAQAYGCTISQLMDITFKPDSLRVPQGQRIEPRYSWMLHNIPASVKAAIKVEASKQAMAIPDFLAMLIKQYKTDKDKQDDMIEQIAAIIRA
jgi:hypothetical protein